MRVAIITNMPAPYRVPAWNRVAERLGENFLVIFCCHREPNRNWKIGDMKFNHIFLKENFSVKRDGTTFVHNNRDVWRHLIFFKPDIIITGGYNPTMLYAFAYSLLKKKKHIPISDGWERTEKTLSPFHKLLRRFVFKNSNAFVACSVKGKDYYKSFSVKDEAIFISHYAIIDSITTSIVPYEGREYDILFSGQFTPRKNPLFFIRVVNLLKQVRKNIRILLIGDGELKDEIIRLFKKYGIDFSYPGYVSQEKILSYYASSKIFLFPTMLDAWGVVANEALTVGTPVIVSPYAGCAEELVIKEFNGYVLDLNEQIWANHCMQLLNNKEQWQFFSNNAVTIASKFNHTEAAAELIKACKFAFANN
jgi:glycosyltransferase involved in cell wall biosynthesis